MTSSNNIHPNTQGGGLCCHMDIFTSVGEHFPSHGEQHPQNAIHQATVVSLSISTCCFQCSWLLFLQLYNLDNSNQHTHGGCFLRFFWFCFVFVSLIAPFGVFQKQCAQFCILVVVLFCFVEVWVWSSCREVISFPLCCLPTSCPASQCHQPLHIKPDQFTQYI